MVLGDEISQMDTKEAFYALQSYLDDADEKDEEGQLIYPDLEETYRIARYGVNIRFDIYDYLNNAIIMKEKKGVAMYRGRSIDLSDLWTELEKRTIKMRKWLKNNAPQGMQVTAYD